MYMKKEVPYSLDEYSLYASNDFSEDDWETIENVLNVQPGELVTGGMDKRFISCGFVTCSGIILRSENSQMFGLLHAIINGEIAEETCKSLPFFRNGDAVIVSGSRSISQDLTVEELKKTYNISIVGKYSVDTSGGDGKQTFFDIVYRPEENGLFVSVGREKDIQQLSGFSVRL